MFSLQIQSGVFDKPSVVFGYVFVYIPHLVKVSGGGKIKGRLINKNGANYANTYT